LGGRNKKKGKKPSCAQFRERKSVVQLDDEAGHLPMGDIGGRGRKKKNIDKNYRRGTVFPQDRRKCKNGTIKRFVCRIWTGFYICQF